MRLKEIRIKNYKSIDDLSLRFDEPLISGEPDVFVIGSKNGIGKTSLLECCAWGAMAAARPALNIDFMEYYQRAGQGVDLSSLMVRAGQAKATIDVLAARGDAESGLVQVLIDEHKLSTSGKQNKNFLDLGDFYYLDILNEVKSAQLFDSILGLTGKTLLLREVLFFNSYRKVSEGGVDLFQRNKVERGFSFWNQIDVYDRFKTVVIHLLMGKSGLFEDGVDILYGDEVIETLNQLMMSFSGGKIDKIRPMSNGSLDLRVMMRGQSQSISFDGLSSGQKEIISTLFLIWYESQIESCVVLIDEPELHLNAEWQRAFVQQLSQLAPQNQYILATHAEEIFRSVPEHRRILLEP